MWPGAGPYHRFKAYRHSMQEGLATFSPTSYQQVKELKLQQEDAD